MIGQTLQDLVVALGLFLVIEGVLYALFPAALKRFAAQLPSIPDSNLRTIGVFVVSLGVLVVWLARS